MKPLKQITMENSYNLPLHEYHVQKQWSYFNRTYILLHIISLSTIFHYRLSFLLNKNHTKYQKIPSFPWLSISIAELILSLLWLLKQPFYWRPVTRTAFPERLGKDKVPKMDVFVCTADSEREPTWDVINTVISAMALDYPGERLSVYLSDDGGGEVTLMGLEYGWAFATWWLPFCRKYGVKCLCPLAFFDGVDDYFENQCMEFVDDVKMIKEKYEVFKMKLQGKLESDGIGKDHSKTGSRDHPARIKEINANSIENDVKEQTNPDHGDMPRLIYVAREKKPSHPHNFKAGALNVLLRASSMLSNSPYILVLDCDMYCNDSISARQAMCFFLDPKISPSLGWVQFPQDFHNTDDSDMYSGNMRTLFHILWHGADGLQGPVISGTNFYIKREALYGIDVNDGNDLMKLKEALGTSNGLIKSVKQVCSPNNLEDREFSSASLQEVELLASCTYEHDTQWGKTVGFRYGSVVEDAMTGYALQSKGWISAYLNPSRPQFLGSCTTNLNDTLSQGIRWFVGLLDISVSRNCPFFYKQSRMQSLHKMSSSWILLFPLDFIPIYIFATIPPLCFLYGIPLYPQVSNPFLVAFAFVFIASRLRNLYAFLRVGGTIKGWYNDQFMWMLKGVTSYLYGTLEFAMAKISLREATFIPTNKVGDDDKTKYYKMGKYDFRISNMFLVPLGALVILNLLCFIGGVARMVSARIWDMMVAQFVLSLYVLVMSYPLIEGMFLRTDNGRVPISATSTSFGVSLVILASVYLIIGH